MYYDSAITQQPGDNMIIYVAQMTDDLEKSSSIQEVFSTYEKAFEWVKRMHVKNPILFAHFQIYERIVDEKIKI